MRSSSSVISVVASAQKLDVDNRISLRYYYRIADNLLRKADIYREEKNVIDLYIILLRFSSLITETIPYHKDYQVLLRRERLSFRKKLLNALTELEALQPLVLSRIEELSRKHTNQVNRWHRLLQNRSNNSSLEWPPIKKQTPTNYAIRQGRLSACFACIFAGYHYYCPYCCCAVLLKVDLQGYEPDMHSIKSLSIPRPKEETLSRHSIFGPNGLHGHWHPPIVDKGVQYPINLDSTPIENPSLHPPFEGGVTIEKDQYKSEPEKSTLESVLQMNDSRWSLHAEEPCPTVISDTTEAPVQTDIIRQPSPPPVLADVHDLMSITSTQVTDLTSGPEKSFQDELVCHEPPSQLHISTQMMDSFMRLAKSNTDRNLETCGILSGSLKKRTFYVTSLIIPKQESTSDFCQTTNEEEIFDVQDKKSLFPLGWIHTHPTQSCFMSSIDLHTHYSYQIMLPEAIAIVMAPKDSSRTHGIFRLTAPGGMSLIRQCQQRGFHPHDEPPEGCPIYDHCTDVYMNPSLKFDVIDLR
ncbi:AMSH-like protein ubiquitin thioesterase 1 [Cinnamomum micranthum f. kanehirae]|uniref:AMSH-like protein ubiquitin thioesterase 1 n=1 Tax=Cinnamomum micranthum f. kanehirae TaxID=337451 RepID=A0A443P3P8_9MAGN|nr:AMSH-like protein ubiquitin thioesterase 1 [Cinnamomum micranthum f. kanehirae]